MKILEIAKSITEWSEKTELPSGAVWLRNASAGGEIILLVDNEYLNYEQWVAKNTMSKPQALELLKRLELDGKLCRPYPKFIGWNGGIDALIYYKTDYNMYGEVHQKITISDIFEE